MIGVIGGIMIITEDVMIEMMIVMKDDLEDVVLFVEVKTIGKENVPKDMEEVSF